MKNLAKKFALVAVAATALMSMTGCAENPDKVKNTLEAEGYTSIEVKGIGWTGCGDDDDFTTKFTAVNPTKTMQVDGVVCTSMGPFSKGATVRIIDTHKLAK